MNTKNHNERMAMTTVSTNASVGCGVYPRPEREGVKPSPTAETMIKTERIVSIGGWCGVAITVRNKMGLCPEAFPFDYILSSFQGVIHFLKNDFDNFFPEKLSPFMEDGFKKFAGTHTIFLHHDLENPEVVETFKRRIKRLLNLLAQEKNPVLFVRASGAYFDEAHLIPEFIAVIREKFPALKFRLLFISHYPCGEENSRPTDPDVIIRYLDTDEFWEEDYPRLVGEVI